MPDLKTKKNDLNLDTSAFQGLNIISFWGGFAVTDFVLQPIMPFDLPVKVRSWELTVYPRSHIRRWLGVTRSAKARM